MNIFYFYLIEEIVIDGIVGVGVKKGRSLKNSIKRRTTVVREGEGKREVKMELTSREK